MADNRKYAVIIDAGSSGSRVYVYQWEVLRWQDRHRTDIKDVDGWVEKDATPGLATNAPVIATVKEYDLDASAHISEQLPLASSTTVAAETLKRVTDYLRPLIEHAQSFVPPPKHRDTPLFVLATGGMRRIELTQYESYDILCTAINTYLKSTPFKEPMFTTISGEDESLYGWVAVNYVDQRFKSDTPPKVDDTHGFMELGGESAQFAVSLTEEESRPYKGPLRVVKVWGVPYVVYVKTWMGLGGDSAWKRHLQRLRQSDSTMPLDPCLPTGYSFRLPGSDKIVRGTGNFVECLKEALSLMDCPNKSCHDGDLCVYRCKEDGDVNVPESVGCLLRDATTGNPLLRFNQSRFCGASVYWHATHGTFGSVSKEKEPEDLQTFWDTVIEHTERDWETLKADKPREKRTGYIHLRRAFFTAAMVMATLFLGFGVPMPLPAIKTARAFAKERAKYAKLAAEVAEENADKDSKVKHAALIRKIADAGLAQEKERVMKIKVEESDEVVETAASVLEDIRKVFTVVPNEANRRDLINAVPDRLEDTYATCVEEAREARRARKQAGDDAKLAYDKLLEAQQKRRDITRLSKRVGSGERVDELLENMFNGQEDKTKYSSLKKSNWPLGRILLHVTGCNPEMRTRLGWKRKIRAMSGDVPDDSEEEEDEEDDGKEEEEEEEEEEEDEGDLYD